MIQNAARRSYTFSIFFRQFKNLRHPHFQLQNVALVTKLAKPDTYLRKVMNRGVEGGKTDQAGLQHTAEIIPKFNSCRLISIYRRKCKDLAFEPDIGK